MSESDPCVTSAGSSASEVYSLTDSLSSHSSPINAIISTHICGPPSASSVSNRTTSSGASSDDSMSSRGMTVYEANIARQLLALKEGVPSDILTQRCQRQFIDDTRKDAAYWERRRKNNEAAKRSREKRRFIDMAMESQISQVQQVMDSLRNELMGIKRFYGLDTDKAFVPPSSDSVIPTAVALGPPTSHVRLPPPGAHMMFKPPESRVNPSMLLRAMPHISHPSVQVIMKPVPQTPPCPSSSGGDEGYWTNEQSVSDTTAEANPRQDDQTFERANEHCSPEDVYQVAEDSTQQNPTQDEQDTPLNLVFKPEKLNKETSEELSIRMHEEVARRYEEIKAGSVDHIAEANRDSGVVSPSGSTSSTSSGSPYSKRLRVDESDSVMEAESISTGSENTSSETAQSPNRVVMDAKYVERRKRNNEASRRSRENRKHIAKTREEKTDVLELENNKLRQELNSLASAVSSLKQMIVAKHETPDKEGAVQTDGDVEKEGQTFGQAS